MRARRARLQVEALEERCLLSWGPIPPATIVPPVAALAVKLNTQGDAAIAANEITYYKFEVDDASATYIISASTPFSNLDTVLGVYDATGLRFAFNDDSLSTNFDSRLSLFLEPGTYYFGITNLAGTAGGTYTWAVDAPSGFYENNDTLALASDLGPLTDPTSFRGLTLADSADWYRFTMSAAGTSGDQVAIQYAHAEGDLQLELTNSAGAVLGESLRTIGIESISLNGRPAGVYYIRVYGRDGAVNPSFYTLDIDPGTTPVSPMSLDGSGAGAAAGIIKLGRDGNGFLVPVPDVINFTATVTGRMSILMRADTQFMQSLLSATSPTTIASQAFVASQFEGTRDHVIQFNVVAGSSYQFNASVFQDPTRSRAPAVGAYRLFLSTEPLGSDFSATMPRLVALDASGSGLQLGTLETLGDVDLFAFTTAVTGRTTVRVDGGADENQVVHLLTTPGQTFAVQVSDPGRTGVYVLTITSIADDIPDSTVFPVVLDAAGSGNHKGSINYAGDVDFYRFTATQTGTMTARMLSRPGIESLSALISELSVTPTPTAFYESSPSRFSTAGNPAFDRILQFQVVQGQQFTIRAAGADGSSGDYLLSFAMAVDDHTGAPETIDLFPPGVPLPLPGSITRPPVTQMGSIETPQDQDRFQFSTGEFEGFMIVALEPTAGTNMQGLLTVPSLLADPSLPAAVGPPQSGPGWQFVHFGPPPPTGGILFQAFSDSGWEEGSRSAFLGFTVKKNSTYEFVVSGNQTTIGEYQLTLGTYRAFENAELYGFDDTFLTRNANRIPNVDAISTNTRFLKFMFSNLNAPLVSVEDKSIAPLPESGNNPGPTNTRLAVFTLPSTSSSTTVTVPSGPATVAPNTLIASLLIVAARDNAVRPVENVVVAQGADAASTFLTSLLIGVIATTTGGDADTTPVLGGTVFEDGDGDGRLQAGEPGVAGETVVLEERRGGQYVLIATAVTDTKGVYTFANVAAGEYRVRLVEAGATTTPVSFAVKVTGDSKSKTLNFGKPGKRGQMLRPAASPTYLAAMLDDVETPQVNSVREESGRTVLTWSEDGGAAMLDDGVRDCAATDWWWAGAVWLLPAAMVGIATGRRDRRRVADGRHAR